MHMCLCECVNVNLVIRILIYGSICLCATYAMVCRAHVVAKARKMAAARSHASGVVSSAQSRMTEVARCRETAS